MASIEEMKQRADRLVEERERLGLKAIEVYGKLNLAQSTLRNYEIGERDMPVSLLVGLMDMGYDAMYVLKGVRHDLNARQGGIDGNKPNLSDDLIQKIEDDLMRCGLVLDEDFTRKDLVDKAIELVVKQHVYRNPFND